MMNLYYDELVEIRRYLHMHPELSFKEENTAEFIKNYLNKLGVKCETEIAGHGIAALIKGYASDKTYAFRADMDALPVCEETGRSFKSVIDGVMHACGHDGHMTMLLILAKVLTSIKEKLKDDVLLIFQPAEEATGGAKPMIDAGLLHQYKVGAVFGYHMFPELEQGKIGITKGPAMAMTGEIDVEILGKKSHGAMPQKGTDAIISAAQFINMVQTIITRKISPLDNAVVTFGKISGGDIRNIIADRVFLEGTIRAFDVKVFESIADNILRIAEGLKIINGVKVDVDIRKSYPPVINNAELTQICLKSIDNAVEIKPVMLADDFSYYQTIVPGVYMMLGCKNDKYGYPLHSSKFDFDEQALLYGLNGYINIMKHLNIIKKN